jgi:hypothetical protein
MNEDDLLSQIRAAFHDMDPVPSHVLAAGRSAIAWREPGAGLAELVQDQGSAGSGMRGGGTRVLTFAGADLSVEVEVTEAGRNVELVGRLVPATSAHVRVRHLTRAHEEIATRADSAGRFALMSVPQGLVSLVFALPDASAIVTSWIRL